MALKLVVPVKFMNSEYLPEVCLFSGRTDQVSEKNASIDYLHPAMRVVVLVLILSVWVLGLIVYLVAKKSVTLTLPQSPWEKFKWGFKRQIWAVVLVVLPCAGCFLALIIDPQHGGSVGLGLGIGALLGLLIAIGLGYWGLTTTMAFKVMDPDTVELKFPERMEATYKAYADAYAEFKLEHQKKGRRPSGGQDEDDWVDEGKDAGWDQAKSKPKS